MVIHWLMTHSAFQPGVLSSFTCTHGHKTSTWSDTTWLYRLVCNAHVFFPRRDSSSLQPSVVVEVGQIYCSCTWRARRMIGGGHIANNDSTLCDWKARLVAPMLHWCTSTLQSIDQLSVGRGMCACECVFMYAWLCVKVGHGNHEASLLAAWTSDSWAQTDPGPSSSAQLRFRPVHHGTDAHLEMINDKPW